MGNEWKYGCYGTHGPIDTWQGKRNRETCEECKQRELDRAIRDMIISSAVDVSKLRHEPPYPLIWDENFNFIAHIAKKWLPEKKEPVINETL